MSIARDALVTRCMTAVKGNHVMKWMNWFARWTGRASKSFGSLGVGVRAALGGGPPGGWASDHREETAHYTGFNYVAIHAIAAQVAEATVTVFADGCEQVQRQARRKSLAVSCGTFGRWKSTYGADDRETDSLSSTHPLVRLLKRPNPYETGATFRYRQAQQIRLTGTCLIWNVPNRSGTTCERYVIPTGMASPVSPTPDLPKGGWRISPTASRYTPTTGDGFVEGPSWYRILGQIVDARQVQVIRLPHPWYLDDGQSPLSAGAKWVDAGEAVDTARFHQLRNGIDPSIVWNLPPDVSPDQDEIDRIQAKISAKYGGPVNVGRVLVAQNGTSITSLSASPKEMCYSEGFQDFKAAILALHQTPPVAVGLQEPGAYAAYNASMKAWRHAAIQPLCDMLAESETEHLAPQFGDGLTVAIESDTVDDTELIERQLQNDLAAKSRTRNEWRSLRGMPPLPGRLGEELVGSVEPGDSRDFCGNQQVGRDGLNERGENQPPAGNSRKSLETPGVNRLDGQPFASADQDAPPVTTTESDERKDRRVELIAEILYGLYGDALFRALDGIPPSSGKTFDPELHPRDERGRFVHRGSGEAIAAARQIISHVLQNPHTVEISDPRVLASLQNLSQSQLESLHREHGIVPPPESKDVLIESIRARLYRSMFSSSDEPPQSLNDRSTRSNRVDVHVQDARQLNRILGRTMETDHWIGVVGAQPGARVHVFAVSSNCVQLEVQHPDYRAVRQVRPDTIYNESFNVRPEMQGRGIGTKVLSQQVEMALALKFKSLETFAAGTGQDLRNEMSNDLGYYAWARLGYDGDVRQVIDARKEGTDEEFATIADFYTRFGDVKKVSEMMMTEERRDWWKRFGGGFDARFDLHPKSRARRVLAAYIAERAVLSDPSTSKQWLTDLFDLRQHVLKGQQLNGPNGRGEVADRFTPEEEAILDQIWDRIATEDDMAAS